MVSPWTILGWLLVVLVGMVVAFWVAVIGYAAGNALYAWLKHKAGRKWHRWRALRTPPERGQIWEQDGRTRLYVKKVTPQGEVTVSRDDRGHERALNDLRDFYCTLGDDEDTATVRAALVLNGCSAQAHDSLNRIADRAPSPEPSGGGEDESG